MFSIFKYTLKKIGETGDETKPGGHILICKLEICTTSWLSNYKISHSSEFQLQYPQTNMGYRNVNYG